MDVIENTNSPLACVLRHRCGRGCPRLALSADNKHAERGSSGGRSGGAAARRGTADIQPPSSRFSTPSAAVWEALAAVEDRKKKNFQRSEIVKEVSGFSDRGTAMPSDFISFSSVDLDLHFPRSLCSEGEFSSVVEVIVAVGG